MQSLSRGAYIRQEYWILWFAYCNHPRFNHVDHELTHLHHSQVSASKRNGMSNHALNEATYLAESSGTSDHSRRKECAAEATSRCIQCGQTHTSNYLLQLPDQETRKQNACADATASIAFQNMQTESLVCNFRVHLVRVCLRLLKPGGGLTFPTTGTSAVGTDPSR